MSLRVKKVFIQKNPDKIKINNLMHKQILYIQTNTLVTFFFLSYL